MLTILPFKNSLDGIYKLKNIVWIGLSIII